MSAAKDPQPSHFVSGVLAVAALLLCAWPVVAAFWPGATAPELRSVGGLVMALGALSCLIGMNRTAHDHDFSMRSHWGGLGGGLGGWTFSKPLAFALVGLALATAATAALMPAQESGKDPAKTVTLP